MTHARLYLSAAGLLTTVLASQVAFNVWRRTTPPLVGPTVGAPFPAVPAISSDSIAAAALSAGGAGHLRSCTLLVFVSTACGVCQRMRYTWAARFRTWRDSVGAPLSVIWVAPQDSADQAGFYEGFDLDDVKKAQLADVDALTPLGIYGTPTLYLLDRNRRLRLGALGDVLPPADSVRHVCQ